MSQEVGELLVGALVFAIGAWRVLRSPRSRWSGPLTEGDEG